MLSEIKNFLQNNSGFNPTMLGVSAIASLEMGVHMIINITQSGDKNDLTADLSGIPFLGLAAATPFPGTRKAAGIALSFLEEPDEQYRQ